MDGYGGYHREISGATPEVQAWFDQGFQLVYGFNHDAAVRCFAAAAELDPNSPMAWWGIAYAYGVDVNNGDVEELEALSATAAAQEALRLIDRASPAEAALIRAVSKRAVSPLPDDRAPLDEAYAEAMQQAWQEFPNDPDVGALYAESLMNLQPWNYWTAEGEAVERAEEIVSVLETVMQLDPLHPGANHFYIHAVEASGDKQRAVAAAERLENLVPGSGHLVHMPSHIYINVGRYGDAADLNERAIAADKAYFANFGEPTFYHLYYIHNIHFLSYAAMMQGRSEVAIQATRDMESEVPEQFLRAFPEFGDGLMGAKYHALIRFGRWEEILGEADAPEFRKASRALRRYARTVALANLGRTTEAREELKRFDAAVDEVPETWMVGVNPAATILSLARQMAEGEILWREGRADEAIVVLRAAVDAQEELVYDEPPGWMVPVRHALGAILLASGHAEEAVSVYQADLKENPENAWGLLGLSQAFAQSGQVERTMAVADQLEQAWSRADIKAPASCYCGVPVE